MRVIKSKRMRWTGHEARITGAYRILTGKHEVKRPVERPRHKWENNIKIGLKEIKTRVGAGLIWLGIEISSRFL
jgi:hypothetical protein